jgi:hypothetical protein
MIGSATTQSSMRTKIIRRKTEATIGVQINLGQDRPKRKRDRDSV